MEDKLKTFAIIDRETLITHCKVHYSALTTLPMSHSPPTHYYTYSLSPECGQCDASTLHAHLCRSLLFRTNDYIF